MKRNIDDLLGPSNIEDEGQEDESTDIDLTQRPEVEYDDSGEGTITISWLTKNRRKMFSVVLVDGAIVGVNCDLAAPNGQRPWKVKLPKGAIRINCNAFTNKLKLEE